MWRGGNDQEQTTANTSESAPEMHSYRRQRSRSTRRRVSDIWMTSGRIIKSTKKKLVQAMLRKDYISL